MNLNDRIAARVKTGDISTEDAQVLMTTNNSGDPNRAGMVWFIFTRGPLQDEGDVIRLLQSWGGEALYNSHEADANLGPLLRGIGTPCVVEARVPLDDVNHFGDIGERMRRGFLIRRGVFLDNNGEMTGYVRKTVGADRIIAVHRLGAAEFEALTQCSKWWRKLS
jgi:hypothetical protein